MFFDKFREAWARLPAGLIRVCAPASANAVAAAEIACGRSLPEALRSFLLSFDGVDLFHGSITIAGVGPDADPRIGDLNGPDETHPGDLVFAEAGPGDRFALDATGRVWRLRAGSEERALAGSSFERWLNAVVAREQILYDADGEFKAEAFQPDGEEVTPKTARQQAERALRQDPGSAEAQHELGTALRRLGRNQEAIAAFTAATQLDPENPWPWFDLGRAHLSDGGDAMASLAAFRHAAERESGLAAARLFAWAARAAALAGAAGAEALVLARQDARAHDAAIEEDLRRALDAAAGDGPEALEEARALLEGLTGRPSPAPRKRLPLAQEDAGTRAAPIAQAAQARRPPSRPKKRNARHRR